MRPTFGRETFSRKGYVDLNSCTISGNLTRDPELRHTPGGTSVCSLRLASNRRQKDGSGEWGDVVGYFDVTVWGGRGEFVADKLAKGDKVYVTGRLEWREWEAQDGSKRQATQIVAENIESPDFFEKRVSGDNGGERQSSAPPAPSTADDDDIPF